MEQPDQSRSQTTSEEVGNVARYESDKNCFLREDCFIDFNNLVDGFNNNNISESIEGYSFSPDTSGTESATEEVEEIGISLVGDDIIIFQTDDDIKQAYPNMEVFNDTENGEVKLSVLEGPHDEMNLEQFAEATSVQELAQSRDFEPGVNSEPTTLEIQHRSESTLEPTSYYYVDSFPLTKNPPDTEDGSNYDESGLEGVYTVGAANDGKQCVYSDEMIDVITDRPNETGSRAQEEYDSVVIISMKKFVVDKSNGMQFPAPQQPSHKWKRLYECQQCGKKFSHGVNLKIHMAVHTRELHPHKCAQCGVSFAKSSQLARHAKRHNAARPKKNLDCLVCEATYKTFGHLRHHMLTVHGVNVKPDPSQNLAPTNSGAQTVLIVRPIKAAGPASSGRCADRVATGPRPSETGIAADLLKCPVCDKAYKSRGSFRKHVNGHGEVERFVGENDVEMIDGKELISSEIGFKCPTCGACFGDLATIVKHKSAAHRPFDCPKKICRAKFSHKHLLDEHLSRYKSRVRKEFDCCACRSRFVSEVCSNSHGGLGFPRGVPYRCAKCFSRMIGENNLKRFLRH